jgi:hypothetical protein
LVFQWEGGDLVEDITNHLLRNWLLHPSVFCLQVSDFLMIRKSWEEGNRLITDSCDFCSDGEIQSHKSNGRAFTGHFPLIDR